MPTFVPFVPRGDTPKRHDLTEQRGHPSRSAIRIPAETGLAGKGFGNLQKVVNRAC
jgi:hypothetical protein